MRQLHDTMQQQVCALKTLGYDLPGKFITWMWTLFEKQKHSQASTDVPHYQKILAGLYWPLDLSFWDLMHNNRGFPNAISTSEVTIQNRCISRYGSSPTDSNCIVCKADKHPSCLFKDLILMILFVTFVFICHCWFEPVVTVFVRVTCKTI